LGRIEFVAAILADNPRYDSDSQLMVTQDLLQEKSTDLMAAIVRYFNSALIYFRQDFFRNTKKVLAYGAVNVFDSVLKGAQIYDNGKQRLDTAISEYDQTVMHFTACLLAGKPFN
jgi:hypothetical protein